MLELIKRFQQKYRVARIVNCFKAGALDELVDFFDITITQNIDSIKLMTERRHKMVGRIGGTRTFGLTTTPFDKELKQVGAVIATNGKLFELGKRNNDDTFLIPNGIDLELFKPRPERQQLYNNNSSRPFITGFAGNVENKLCSSYKGWYWYIQATMRLYPEVETLNFLFHSNQIPHNQMPEKFYHKIDCLVLPSFDEGCSNVTIEALACGVPVLTTKVGFHGERLEDGVNCLFIKRDIDDITGKIRLLMNTPELRQKLAFEGRIFAENNHNIDKIAREYNRVFEHILKINNRGPKGELSNGKRHN